jgi:hypothetical protein
LLFIIKVKHCRGQSGWCNKLQDIETINLLHVSFCQEFASYTLVLLISKSLLLHCKDFINALGISYCRFVAGPQQGCSEIAWTVQIISVMLVEGWLASSLKRTITLIIRKAYHFYFVCQTGEEDKNWAPHICCNTCAANLHSCLSHKRWSMPFAIPIVWREWVDGTTLNCNDVHGLVKVLILITILRSEDCL